MALHNGTIGSISTEQAAPPPRNNQQSYQSVCDMIRNHDKVESVGLFPAVPVSAAFEIGRRYMPGVYPVLHIFDDDQGFFETLSIGERNK